MSKHSFNHTRLVYQVRPTEDCLVNGRPGELYVEVELEEDALLASKPGSVRFKLGKQVYEVPETSVTALLLDKDNDVIDTATLPELRQRVKSGKFEQVRQQLQRLRA